MANVLCLPIKYTFYNDGVIAIIWIRCEKRNCAIWIGNGCINCRFCIPDI